jgi:hypothetical protein
LFFTHPRNVGRQDIRCPFGCRQAHKKKSSNKRSKEYYQSAEGGEKKKELNERRGKSENNKPEKTDADDKEHIDQDLLIHLQLVAWHIEGKCVALDMIRIMVKTLVRQHRIDRLKKRVYHCPDFFKQPP